MIYVALIIILCLIGGIATFMIGLNPKEEDYGKRTKNNLNDFLSTRFVLGIEDGAVEFDYDTRPSKLGHLSVFYPPYYRGEVKKEKSMRGIPVEHARWIGSLLNQLTDEQLRDAFRAANYEEEIREGYARSLRMRIDQLGRL